MAPQKKTHGIGAVVSVLTKFVHPSQLIRDKFPNLPNGHRLSGCITLRQEVKRINQKEKLSLIVKHDDFKNDDEEYQELHACKRHFQIQEEGDPEFFFDIPQQVTPTTEDQSPDMPVAIDAVLEGEHVGGVDGLIAALQGVVDIDDDNDPAPENVPVPGDQAVQSVLETEWGHSGLCFRRQENLSKQKARLHFPVDKTMDDVNLQLFEGLFPKEYLENVVLTETNQHLNDPLSYGELLRWIGLLSTVDGSDRRSFWSTKAINMYEGAPFQIQHFMSRTCFEAILSAIKYTKENPPAFVDHFWEVCELIDAWNESMSKNFSPSWINTIDESISKWINEFTCPGFMYIPRKPWPFGNEYHDAGCADSAIIWQVDLREGKDRPVQLGGKEHDDRGKTTGTLLQLTKPVHGTGKVFVLALVELKKCGVYAHALIKKRRYWPKYIPGEAIKEHFRDKEVGSVDALKGQLDGVLFISTR